MNPSPSLRDPIEALADEYMARLRRGESPSVEEYAQAYPAHAEQIRTLFPTIAALEGLKSRGQRSPAAGAPLAGLQIERLGDLRIVREIGRGGMGIVYEAEQESLTRRVAVKVLPQQLLLNEKHLLRFRREAKTAARLHHTNIVPVLGVGQSDGYHFIVMQFIRGVGLDEIVAELSQVCRDGSASQPRSAAVGSSTRAATISRAARSLLGTEPTLRGWTADPSASTLRNSDVAGPRDVTIELPGMSADGSVPATEQAPPGNAAAPSKGFNRGGHQLTAAYWQSVARIGQQVASALAYAHQQRVFHRDIKPANLLIDGDGVVWVADFGLAKSVQHEEVSRTGEVVGTLRYMAPEQMRGDADARSDLYSLGLTLYELLALEPAFDEAARREAYWKNLPGRALAPLRRKHPAIPRDLETIVLKCAAEEPERRYQTAEELVEDFERFLADRPIAARRAGPIERLARWTRRHPLVAGLSSLVAVLILAVIAITGVAYARTSEALQEQSLQRQRAETTLGVSLEALDKIYRRFAPERVLAPVRVDLGDEENQQIAVPTQPAFSRENAELLEEMLTFYDRFAALDAGSVTLRAETARANRRVADIHQRLGETDKAAAAYGQAIERYEQLAGMVSDPVPFQTEIARIHNELGNVALRQGDLDKGTHSYQTALDLLGKVTASQMPAVRYELARTHYLLGRRHETPALPDDGPPRHGPRHGPPGPGGPGGFGGPPRHAMDGRPEQGPPGGKPPGGGPSLYSLLFGGPPEERRPPVGPPRHRPSFGDPPEEGGPRGPGPSGDHHRQPAPTPLTDAQREHLAQAIALLTPLCEEQPAAPEYRRLLAVCHRELSDGYESDQNQQAIAILQQLTADYPAVADYRYDLCETYAAIDVRGGPRQGDDALEEQLRHARTVAAKLGSTVPAYVICRVRIDHKLAHVLSRGAPPVLREQKWERIDEAVECCREAIALQSQLVDQFPATTSYRAWRAQIRRTLAELLAERRHPEEVDETLALLQGAAEDLEQLISTDTDQDQIDHSLHQIYGTLGRVLHDAGMHQAAEVYERQVEEHHRKMRPRP